MLLNGVVSEIAPILEGQSLRSIRQSVEGDLLLEFAAGDRGERVRLAAWPGRSLLYALRGHPPLAETPSLFVALVAAEGAGGRLESLTKETDERVVLFRLHARDGPRTLVAELLGRSANLLWLDGEERILAFARALKSEFRRPRGGDPYRPPPAGDRPSLRAVSPEDLEDLARGAEGVPGALAHQLTRAVRGLSPLLAREIEHRVRSEGRPPSEAWAEMQARLRAGLWEPRLYAPGPPEALAEDTPLEPGVFFVAPWEMSCAAGLDARLFASFSEALELHDRLGARWLRFEKARRELERSFATEARRLERLRAALLEDRRIVSEAERFRRWGELLMREKCAFRLEGDAAVVVDRYGSGGEERIPFDRRVSPRENAEALFRRYRRAKRAAPQIDRRTRELEGKLEQVRALAAQASAARSLAETQALADRWKIMPRGGAQSRTLWAAQGEGGPQAQAREYRSSDGWTILVGRGALANDRLTFGVGTPHDFWLHAAEVPGAHVLVRNPARAAEMPPRTLEEAAALAAWFSGGRSAAAVEVHYTQRRHVRRPRGAPPGRVLLKRFRTLRVRPLPPAGT